MTKRYTVPVFSLGAMRAPGEKLPDDCPGPILAHYERHKMVADLKDDEPLVVAYEERQAAKQAAADAAEDPDERVKRQQKHSDKISKKLGDGKKGNKDATLNEGSGPASVSKSDSDPGAGGGDDDDEDDDDEDDGDDGEDDETETWTPPEGATAKQLDEIADKARAKLRRYERQLKKAEAANDDSKADELAIKALDAEADYDLKRAAANAAEAAEKDGAE